MKISRHGSAGGSLPPAAHELLPLAPDVLAANARARERAAQAGLDSQRSFSLDTGLACGVAPEPAIDDAALPKPPVLDLNKPATRSLSYVDPSWIEQLARDDPVNAVFKCYQAGKVFREGTRRIRREYIFGTFLSALGIKGDERKTALLTDLRLDLGLDKLYNLEKVRERLLYKVFDAAFYYLPYHTRHNYAHGLEYYWNINADPDSVKSLIIGRGPERLYREALERNRLSAALKEYAASGRSLSAALDVTYFSGPEVSSEEAEAELEEEDNAGSPLQAGQQSPSATSPASGACPAGDDETANDGDVLRSVHQELRELSCTALDVLEALRRASEAPLTPGRTPEHLPLQAADELHRRLMKVTDLLISIRQKEPIRV